MANNEESVLFEYQRQYKNGDSAALAPMYEKLKEIAYKAINSRSNSNAQIAKLTAQERKLKAHDAATYIIEQYLKRPDFIINKSITGYLFTRINWELYGAHQYKRDQIITYTDTLPEHTQPAKQYKYIVKDMNTNKTESFNTIAELYAAHRFSKLSKKKLSECIKTGSWWRHYTFDLIEINT